jgi:hypothetical protein
MWGLVAGLVLIGQVDLASSPEDSRRDNQQRLASMSDEELSELKSHKQRFDALSPSEQDQLRQLHAQLSNHPQEAQLRVVLDRYYEWLKTLNATERAELLSLTSDQRIDRIRELRQEQRGERFSLVIDELSADDRTKLFQWVENLARQKQADIEQAMRDRFETRGDDSRRDRDDNDTRDDESRRDRDNGEARGDERSERPGFRSDRERNMRWEMTRQILERNSPNRHLVLFYMYRGIFGEPPVQLITDVDIASLRSTLSPEGLALLDAQPTDEDRRRMIVGWTMAAVYAQLFPPVNHETLIDFVLTLPPDDRERLDLLPPDDWRREVSRLYHRQQTIGSPVGWGWDRPPRRPDGPRDFGGGPPDSDRRLP